MRCHEVEEPSDEDQACRAERLRDARGPLGQAEVVDILAAGHSAYVAGGRGPVRGLGGDDICRRP